MPSLVAHALVGATATAVVSRTPAAKAMSVRRWLLTLTAAAAAPDLDVLAFQWVPYEHPLGHRGFFHSILAAVVAGLVAACILYGLRMVRGRFRMLLGAWAAIAAVMATHGPLDALTNGGLGIALLSPFDLTRYFLVTDSLGYNQGPIPVAELNPLAMLDSYTLKLLVAETALFAPACAAAWLAVGPGRFRGIAAGPRYVGSILLLTAGAIIWRLQIDAASRGRLWFW